MTKRNNSREEWHQDIIERQHNLTPADINRTSQFRASGLPKSAPLPLAVRRSYIYGGAALFASGLAARVAFDAPVLHVVGIALCAAGLLLTLAAVRWIAK